MLHKRGRVALLTFALCAMDVASAQTTTATLSGIVRDPQGGVIPNAVIAATQTETSQSRQTVSSNTGDYSLPNLPTGNYRITASAPGFKKIIIPSIELQV